MRTRLVALLMVAGVLGCASQSSQTEGDDRRERRVPVTVVEAVTDDVVFTSTKIGAVNVNRQVHINFAVPGRLEEFLVDEDAYVRAGEPIARLDATELEAAVETSQIRLRELSKRTEKLERLLQKDMVTEAEYDQVKTEYLTCQEELRVARDKLSKVRVSAPFAGVVLKRLAEVGSFVPPGVPVAILVDIDTVRVQLDLTDQEIRKIAVGEALQVRADAFPTRRFDGTIDRIVPSVDPRSRMTSIQLLVTNPGRLLKPGMMVRTDIVVGAYQKVISLPVDCLVYQGTNTFVYVVTGVEPTSHRRSVSIGPLYKERVIETGQSYLNDGSLANVLE